MDYISTTPLYDSNYLAHHGIKGQKWGIRRFQNPDGTLTEAGKKKYARAMEQQYNKYDKRNLAIPYDLKKNRVDVRRKILNEWGSSKEAEEYYKASRELDDALDKGQGIKNAEDKYQKTTDRLEKKRLEIRDKYLDDYAKALIKDLDLLITTDAIDFVKKHELFASLY